MFILASIQSYPVNWIDPYGLIAGTLFQRSINSLFRAGFSSQQMAFNAKLTDFFLGALAKYLNLDMNNLLPKDILDRHLFDIGSQCFNVSDMLDFLSGIAGIQGSFAAVTIQRAAYNPYITLGLTGSLAFLGGMFIGDSINNLILDRMPSGNPILNTINRVFFGVD